MIMIPTPQDVMRVSSEPAYFEAIYPLFFISSSIICGTWNNPQDIYTFYHVPLSVPASRLEHLPRSLRQHRGRARAAHRRRGRPLRLWARERALSVDIAIAYNLGCIANMLKGATSNPMSALASLASLAGAEGGMKEEMVKVLQLYLECYPLALAPNTEYLTAQLDALIHRLVTLLKEGMWLFHRRITSSLPYTATLVSSLCSLRNIKALTTCLDVLNQIFSFNKNKHEQYLDPLVGVVTEQYYSELAGDDDAAGFRLGFGSDEIGKKSETVLQFYCFLDLVISYSSSVLYSQTNAPYLSQYLSTLLKGITEIPQIQVNKLCITDYRKLAAAWLDPSTQVPEEVGNGEFC